MMGCQCFRLNIAKRIRWFILVDQMDCENTSIIFTKDDIVSVPGTRTRVCTLYTGFEKTPKCCGL